MSATPAESKLALKLERMFANPKRDWVPLQGGAELRMSGELGAREMLVRRPGGKPSEAELRVFAEHAGFDDWHVFWLRPNAQVAWVVEVVPDGMWDPKLFLEARGKAHLVESAGAAPIDALKGLQALTLKQPWPLAFDVGKRIENRSWQPDKALIGRYIALHGGKNPGAATPGVMADFDFIQSQTSENLFETRTTQYIEGVFAVAKLERVVTESADPWFFGPYGFVLTDYVRLRKPVPCRGQQGFFVLEPAVLDLVRVEFDGARTLGVVPPDPLDAVDYLEAQPVAVPSVVTVADVAAMVVTPSREDRINALAGLSGHLTQQGREMRRAYLRGLSDEDLAAEEREYGPARALGWGAL